MADVRACFSCTLLFQHSRGSELRIIIRLGLTEAPGASIAVAIKTTRYFREHVLRKRPYIQTAWCERIIAEPVTRRGPVRRANSIMGNRALVWRPDASGRDFSRCETVHNAFPRPGF